MLAHTPTTLMKSRILSDSPTNFLPTYFDISSKSPSASCLYSPTITILQTFLLGKKTNIIFLYDGIAYPFEQKCKCADKSDLCCHTQQFSKSIPLLFDNTFGRIGIEILSN